MFTEKSEVERNEGRQAASIRAARERTLLESRGKCFRCAQQALFVQNGRALCRTCVRTVGTPTSAPRPIHGRFPSRQRRPRPGWTSCAASARLRPRDRPAASRDQMTVNAPEDDAGPRRDHGDEDADNAADVPQSVTVVTTS